MEMAAWPRQPSRLDAAANVRISRSANHHSMIGCPHGSLPSLCCGDDGRSRRLLWRVVGTEAAREEASGKARPSARTNKRRPLKPPTPQTHRLTLCGCSGACFQDRIYALRRSTALGGSQYHECVTALAGLVRDTTKLCPPSGSRNHEGAVRWTIPQR